MTRLDYPKPWEEEWYTSWLARKHNSGMLDHGGRKQASRYSPMHSAGSVRPNSRGSVRSNARTVRSKFGLTDDDEEDKEEEATIGRLHTVRYRPGERLSRVHYDYTSFLFKSKWKKKYFPKGIFSLN